MKLIEHGITDKSIYIDYLTGGLHYSIASLRLANTASRSKLAEDASLIKSE